MQVAFAGRQAGLSADGGERGSAVSAFLRTALRATTHRKFYHGICLCGADWHCHVEAATAIAREISPDLLPYGLLPSCSDVPPPGAAIA